jgi:hypothetical protein
MASVSRPVAFYTKKPDIDKFLAGCQAVPDEERKLPGTLQIFMY